jgi:class 3 adenylate cyclase
VAPETRYVDVDDTQVAYQVSGDSSLDVVVFYGLGSHIDLAWAMPQGYLLLDALQPFSRLIRFDRRGSGASGGSRDVPPTWEEWTADLEAVLDASGSDQAAIFAELDAGPIAMLFAASHPERVSALMLSNTLPRWLVDSDYPIGMSQPAVDAALDLVRAQWGTLELARAIIPSRADDPAFVAATARQQRAWGPPRTAANQYRYILERLDVRNALALIQAPTLVLHNTHNPVVSVEHGRYLAHHIKDAKLIEFPSAGMMIDDHLNEAVDAISEFLTGDRPSVPVDRVLTTVLFTDIVESTQRIVELGDHGWRSLLDGHDQVVREQLRRFRGHEIKTTGDGFFAAFDGPGRAIHCAEAILESAQLFGLPVRAGLHIGECEVRGDDLTGVTVNIAARVSELAGPNEILVTSTVRDMVAGSGISFEDRGSHSLKGIAETRQVLAVTA